MFFEFKLLADKNYEIVPQYESANDYIPKWSLERTDEWVILKRDDGKFQYGIID